MPLIMVRVKPNTSPRAGLEAEINNSMSELKRRLMNEAELDAALYCEDDNDSIIVKGRGDLHLGKS